jgi:hypothetical protein
MSRAYPPADFDPPALAEGYGGATWFRAFRCPVCGTILGRQRIGRIYGLDASGYGLVPTGYTIERIELSRGLIALPPTPDGLLRFGLPKRAFLESPSSPGTERRSALRRSTLVLPSVEITDQFNITQRGDPYHVGRHDPRRDTSAEHGDFVLALSQAQALLPFVVTCPGLACRPYRRHWLVAGLPSEAALAAAVPPR